MKLTSIEIRNKDFAKGFRGFVPEEVEYFLEDVALAWEEMQRHASEAEAKIAELEMRLRHYASAEHTMQEQVVESRIAGQEVVDSARSQAQAIIAAAEAKAAAMLDRERENLTQLQEQVIVLKAKRDQLAARLKGLLSSELELIRALEVGEEHESTSEPTLSKEVMDIIKSLDAK
jgi:cell division initiation protein